MQPTIESGNHVLINTLAYGVAIGPLVLTRTPISRGDIVAFEWGHGDDAKAFLISDTSPGALQPGLFQVPSTTTTTLIWRAPEIG